MAHTTATITLTLQADGGDVLTLGELHEFIEDAYEHGAGTDAIVESGSDYVRITETHQIDPRGDINVVPEDPDDEFAPEDDGDDDDAPEPRDPDALADKEGEDTRALQADDRAASISPRQQRWDFNPVTEQFDPHHDTAPPYHANQETPDGNA